MTDDDVEAHVQFLSREAYRGNLPTCAIRGICEDCPLVRRGACSVAADVDFIALLKYYCSIHAGVEEVRERRVTALVAILQRHGLEMHWEFVARIVRQEEPRLFSNDRSVLGTLANNHKWFSEGAPGCYYEAPPAEA